MQKKELEKTITEAQLYGKQAHQYDLDTDEEKLKVNRAALKYWLKAEANAAITGKINDKECSPGQIQAVKTIIDRLNKEIKELE